MQTLTTWQKKQAVLLYLFSSIEYLEELYERVQQLQIYADSILNRSRIDGRDSFLRDSRWGDRDTGENWSNHAWSFLADFRLSLLKDISARRSNIYSITGANQCVRGMSEFSMQWMTHTEQEKFDAMLDSVSHYARHIDKTMDKFHRGGRWDDFGLTLTWIEYASKFANIPKFVIRENIIGETGQTPPITGVYISTTHPDGTLQFAWNGDEYGPLRECAILNQLGREALAEVGRQKLWLDGDAMLGFVQNHVTSPDLVADSYFSNSHTPELAPSLVARSAFTSAPSKWCYVELVEGEFEQLDAESNQLTFTAQRYESGDRCTNSGFYFTPASLDSRRYFNAGETFPGFHSTYGKTIWQWDERQE